MDVAKIVKKMRMQLTQDTGAEKVPVRGFLKGEVAPLSGI